MFLRTHSLQNYFSKI
jgi:hypothetical protein